MNSETLNVLLYLSFVIANEDFQLPTKKKRGFFLLRWLNIKSDQDNADVKKKSKKK